MFARNNLGGIQSQLLARNGEIHLTIKQCKLERASLLECIVFDEKSRKEDVGPQTLATNVQIPDWWDQLYYKVALVNRYPVRRDL